MGDFTHSVHFYIQYVILHKCVIYAVLLQGNFCGKFTQFWAENFQASKCEVEKDDKYSVY